VQILQKIKINILYNTFIKNQIKKGKHEKKRFREFLSEANEKKVFKIKGEYMFQGEHDSEPKVTKKDVLFEINVELAKTGKLKGFSIFETGIKKTTYQNKPYTGKPAELAKFLRTGRIETFELLPNDYNEKNQPDLIGVYYVSFIPSNLQELKQYL
jgi:hypothetical protein